MKLWILLWSLVAAPAYAQTCPTPEPIAKLKVGEEILDPENPVAFDKKKALDLRGVFPTLNDGGWWPWTVIRTQAKDGAPAYGVLLVPKDAALSQDHTISAARFAVLTCTDNVWKPVGQPFEFGTDLSPQVSAVESVTLPDGAQGWTARLFVGNPLLMEFYELVALFGPHSPQHEVTRRAEWGKLAWAECSRQTINPTDDKSLGDYIRNDLVVGSGFVPYQDGQLFIGLQVFSDAPTSLVFQTPIWAYMDGVSGAGDLQVAAWIYAGTGSLPKACAKLPAGSCRALDRAELQRRWGDSSIHWFAGAWPDAVSANKAATSAGLRGGKWYWVGGADDKPKKDPDGKTALDRAKITPAKPAKKQR